MRERLFYDISLRKINSATKYPSILTYHEMVGKGILTENTTVDFKHEDVYLSEKIDGTNTRMIIGIDDNENSDFFIGSRDIMLYAKNDRIINPQLNIVKSLLPICEDLELKMGCDVESGYYIEDGVYTIYGEIYGGNLPQTKHYSTKKDIGYRVFDIGYMPWDVFYELMEKPVEKIASWREHGNQNFLTDIEFTMFNTVYSLDVVPSVGCVSMEETFPETLNETYEFLKNFGITKAGLDCDGKAEGIVVRTENREKIAKIRFEDYERTFRKMKK